LKTTKFSCFENYATLLKICFDFLLELDEELAVGGGVRHIHKHPHQIVAIPAAPAGHC